MNIPINFCTCCGCALTEKNKPFEGATFCDICGDIAIDDAIAKDEVEADQRIVDMIESNGSGVCECLADMGCELHSFEDY